MLYPGMFVLRTRFVMLFLGSIGLAQAYPFAIVDETYGPDPVVQLKVLVRKFLYQVLELAISYHNFAI